MPAGFSRDMHGASSPLDPIVTLGGSPPTGTDLDHLVDEARRRGSVTLVRDGHAVAVLHPADDRSAARLLAVAASHPVDRWWAADLAEVRTLLDPAVAGR